jgi:hypothetical protein
MAPSDAHGCSAFGIPIFSPENFARLCLLCLYQHPILYTHEFVFRDRSLFMEGGGREKIREGHMYK